MYLRLMCTIRIIHTYTYIYIYGLYTHVYVYMYGLHTHTYIYMYGLYSVQSINAKLYILYYYFTPTFTTTLLQIYIV